MFLPCPSLGHLSQDLKDGLSLIKQGRVSDRRIIMDKVVEDRVGNWKSST
jgi:hypothetical protein